MVSRGPRKSINGFDLSQSPSHLLRRCVQYANDLFAHEPTASDITKQQYTVLVAVEQNEGVSQTDRSPVPMRHAVVKLLKGSFRSPEKQKYEHCSIKRLMSG